LQKILRPVDLARSVGLSTQAVRNYEELGFLPVAERGPHGYRLYRPHHLEAIRTARVVIAGFGWEQARHIMQFVHQNDLSSAFGIIDARHAIIHQSRREVEETLKSLKVVATAFPSSRKMSGQSRRVHIGEVARRVGVRVSAIRFWEEQELVQPERNNTNRYRLYDEQQVRLLQIVALLRKVGYGFEAIRAVLTQVAMGTPEQALRAAENRLKELAEMSRCCMEATAVLWAYIGRFVR
jgi:DNA-binding transcriptional MerR regulator